MNYDKTVEGRNNPESIIDKFPLKALYFYLTGSCNLACKHCWINPKFTNKETIEDGLPFHYFCSIIEQAMPLGLSWVKLTGGEPLLHPQICDILEFLKEHNLDVGIETNGTLVNESLAREIADSCNPSISVSLDSSNPDTHDWIRGVPGSFDKTIIGIRNLVNAGIKPQLIFTLMRCNVNHLQDYLLFAEKLGVGSVKVNILQPSVRSNKLVNHGESLSIEEYVTIGKELEEDIIPKQDIPLIYDHPPAFRSLSRLFGKNQLGCDSCGIKGILGVLNNGSYSLCGMGKNDQDLVFGHCQDSSLKDVWFKHPIINEIREGLPKNLEGPCAECGLRNLCNGCCIAQNYQNSKSLWGSYWYCASAMKNNIFPNRRLFIKEK